MNQRVEFLTPGVAKTPTDAIMIRLGAKMTQCDSRVIIDDESIIFTLYKPQTTSPHLNLVFQKA
jgi:hypothetical protein